MNMTNSDYAAFQDLLKVISKHKEELDTEEINMYSKCLEVMNKLEEKRLAINERTLNAITERRKINKNYARSRLANGKYC